MSSSKDQLFQNRSSEISLAQLHIFVGIGVVLRLLTCSAEYLLNFSVGVLHRWGMSGHADIRPQELSRLQPGKNSCHL
jgi:hypothetical protein